MKASQMTRREMIILSASAALAAGAPNIGLAQGIDTRRLLNSLPEQAGAFHREGLIKTSKQLDGSSLTSRNGLTITINETVKNGLISKDEVTLLQSIVDALFEEKDLASVIDKINSIYKEVVSWASDLVVVIIGIVKDSAEYVLEKFSGKSREQKIFIVATDFVGGIEGAKTGSTFAGPWGAVLGAVSGALATSAVAMFSNECSV